MARPISADIPPGVGDKTPAPPVHPGIYAGTDAREWAFNRIACLQHVNANLRKQETSAAEAAKPLIEHNEREIRMLGMLLRLQR